MVFYNNCRVICAKCGCDYTVTALATQYWHEPYVVEMCMRIFSAGNICPDCRKPYDNDDEIVYKHLLCKPVEEVERGEWYESIL